MVDRFYTTYTGHARGYREYQPKLAVRCPLYAADAVILRPGGALIPPRTSHLPLHLAPLTV